MISLETAKRLKDAGIEPQYEVYCLLSGGRWSRWQTGESIATFGHQQAAEQYAQWWNWSQASTAHIREVYPLDQLLAEIERQGWDWIMDKGSMTLYRDKEWGSQFFGVPDDAAANALLWILEREKVAHDVVHV